VYSIVVYPRVVKGLTKVIVREEKSLCTYWLAVFDHETGRGKRSERRLSLERVSAVRGSPQTKGLGA